MQRNLYLTHVTSIAEEDVPTAFLLNKLTKDFFNIPEMYLIAFRKLPTVSLLGSKAKKPDSVDFPAMLKTLLTRQTYSQDFPDISAWYNGIDSNPAFQYIDARLTTGQSILVMSI
ncbi:MAG: hypothetical protein ACLRX4_04950 [Oscillospiraceae bacterium]